MIVAHDQGLSISINRGKTWFRQRLTNAQMYHVTVDNDDPLQRPREQAGRTHLPGAQQQAPREGDRQGHVALRGGWGERMGDAGSGRSEPRSGHRLPGRGWWGASWCGTRRTGASIRSVEVWPQQSRGAADRGSLSLRLGRTHPHLPPRPQHGVRRQPARAPNQEWRAELGGDQPGPHPERPKSNGALRRSHSRTTSGWNTPGWSTPSQSLPSSRA